MSRKTCWRCWGRYPFDVVVNVEPINELPKMKGLQLALQFAPGAASEFPLMLNVMKVDNTLRMELDYQSAYVRDDVQATQLLKRLSAHCRQFRPPPQTMN